MYDIIIWKLLYCNDIVFAKRMYQRILPVGERESYASQKMHVEEFRFLMDDDVNWDEKLTLLLERIMLENITYEFDEYGR